MKKTEKFGRIKIIQPTSKRKKIVIGAVLAIGIIVAVGQLLSTEYRVVRVKYIKAEPSAIHPYVNDLQKWESWFPWDKLGKRLNVTFGDITSGEGARLNWMNEDGKGLLTLSKSSPENGIDYKLSLYDGFYECDVFLHYTEIEEGKTYISWTVRGDINQPMFGGYRALLMEPIVGSVLNLGLSNLKSIVNQDIENQSGPEQSAEKTP